MTLFVSYITQHVLSTVVVLRTLYVIQHTIWLHPQGHQDRALGGQTKEAKEKTPKNLLTYLQYNATKNEIHLVVTKDQWRTEHEVRVIVVVIEHNKQQAL